MVKELQSIFTTLPVVKSAADTSIILAVVLLASISKAIWSTSAFVNVTAEEPKSEADVADSLPKVFAPVNVCVPDKWAVSASKYALAITSPFQTPVPIVPTVAKLAAEVIAAWVPPVTVAAVPLALPVTLPVIVPSTVSAPSNFTNPSSTHKA